MSFTNINNALENKPKNEHNQQNEDLNNLLFETEKINKNKIENNNKIENYNIEINDKAEKNNKFIDNMIDYYDKKEKTNNYVKTNIDNKIMKLNTTKLPMN